MNPEDIISEFKEDFELDLKDDTYEKIIPVLPVTSSARFIHDFSSVSFFQEFYSFDFDMTDEFNDNFCY